MQSQSLSMWFKIENHSVQLRKTTWSLFTPLNAFHNSKNIVCISHKFIVIQFDISLAYWKSDQIKKQKLRYIVLECSTLAIKSTV
jgi:hypothetical protein